MECGHHYVKLNVERYGGMIYAPWLDRPLSIAGRVIIKDKETNKLQSKLINIDRDLVLIPNLAIHMNRDINSGYQYNPQKICFLFTAIFLQRHFYETNRRCSRSVRTGHSRT